MRRFILTAALAVAALVWVAPAPAQVSWLSNWMRGGNFGPSNNYYYNNYPGYYYGNPGYVYQYGTPYNSPYYSGSYYRPRWSWGYSGYGYPSAVYNYGPAYSVAPYYGTQNYYIAPGVPFQGFSYGPGGFNYYIR